jgi:hypothetical protein
MGTAALENNLLKQIRAMGRGWKQRKWVAEKRIKVTTQILQPNTVRYKETTGK